MATDSNKTAQMRSLVTAWRSSGTGQKAFCTAHDINIHTFKYWVEKLEKLEKPKQNEPNKVPPTPKSMESRESKGFISLQYPQSSSQNALELRFPQGAVLQLGQDLSAASVQILKSLLY
jgi:hypothetical protein